MVLTTISLFLVISTLIPLANLTHWVFRGFEFCKIQLFFLQLIVLLVFFIFQDIGYLQTVVFALLLFSAIFNFKILYKYSKFHNLEKQNLEQHVSREYSYIAANVYQNNTDYAKFIELVKKYEPDFFFTVESNKDWGEALEGLKANYHESISIPQEDTYGMHFYSKLKIKHFDKHNFVAHDLPSLEVDLIDKDGTEFTFFGVHPPPPSPTEETNSKERDGELLSVAKRISANKKHFMIAGDFNTVAWSEPTKLFQKAANLVDARMGRGLLSTFHADYWFLRFPIDLVFHTKALIVKNLEVLSHIGSDHLPLKCSFKVVKIESTANPIHKNLNEQDTRELHDLIEEGKMEEGDR